MGVIFIDGFDHYNDLTELARKGWVYSNPTQNQQTLLWGGGRFGGYYLAFRNNATTNGQYISRSIVQSSVAYFGIAAYFDVLPGSCMLGHFYDSGSAQVGLRVNSDGSISVVRGAYNGTVVATSPKGITTAAWNHYALEVSIHNTAGYIKFWLNGELLIDVSNVNTRATANSYTNQFLVYPAAGNAWNQVLVYVDDLYIGNNSGSINTSCPGDRRVLTQYPNADGANTGWTANTGGDAAAVDETTPDDDTTYIASSTLDQLETFQYPDLPASVDDVTALQIVHYSKKDDAGNRALKPVILSGGTPYELGASQYLGATYAFYCQISEVDPADSVAWDKTKVDAAEFGVVVDV